MIKYVNKGILGKGQHIYMNNFAYFRGSKIKIINKNDPPADFVPEEGKSPNEPQQFQIDGEAMFFSDFVKIEAVPQAVDVIVDYEEMMQ